METSNLSRRDFFKVAGASAAALVVAPLACGAVQPSVALADGNITANAFCEPDEWVITSVIGIKQAYLTNPTVPESVFKGPWPTTPVSGNATCTTDADGSLLVEIPLVNTAFTLTKVNELSADGVASVVDYVLADGRYTSITVRIPSSGLGTTYVFSATEKANLSPFAGTKNWDLNIKVEG